MGQKQKALFGETEPPAPPVKPVNTPYALLREWDRRFEVAHPGTRYVFAPGKDAKMMQRAATAIGAEEVVKLMDLFFASTDRFILEAGHTIPVFVSQINKLLQRSVTPQNAIAVSVLDRLDEIDNARRAR
jgi:hypothetical protein